MSVFVADEQRRPVDMDRLRRLAAFVLADRRVPPGMELSVLCVDRDAMAELNAHHMGETGPTDVLAFPIDMPGETAPGEPAILGDVVLCPDVAAEQAPRSGSTVRRETDLLLVHGILHLLGHDHAEEEERSVMFALTDRLLSTFSAVEDVDVTGAGAGAGAGDGDGVTGDAGKGTAEGVASPGDPSGGTASGGTGTGGTPPVTSDGGHPDGTADAGTAQGGAR